MGFILLEGGAEFGGEMATPDRRALELAGGAVNANLSSINQEKLVGFFVIFP